jgi:hypothetical protein
MQVNNRSRIGKNKMMAPGVGHNSAFRHQIRLLDFKKLFLPHKTSDLGPESNHIMISVHAKNGNTHTEQKNSKGK